MPTANTNNNVMGSASHGIDLVTFALIDNQSGQVLKGTDDGLTDNGLAPIDEGYTGATTVEYQNIETAGTKQYANNKPKRVTTPVQSPTANLTFLDIAWNILNKLTGYEQGEDGGYSLDQSHKPNFAMLTRSTFLDGSALYEAFACAQAIMPTDTHNTDNDSEQDATVSLTVNAFDPIADVFKVKSGKKMPYRRWNSSDPKFDATKMMAQVFPGWEIDDATMKMIVPSYTGSSSVTPNPSGAGSSSSGTNTPKA